MRLRDFKIGTQFVLCFTVMFVFIIVLGVVSYNQSNRINQQTELIYNHSFKVRQAIGSLRVDILTMRLGTRDLMLSINPTQKQGAIELIELPAVDAENQFDTLNDSYLGDRSVVEEAHKAFLKWKTILQENLKLTLAGDNEKVKESFSSTGTVGIYRDQMLAKIKVIDDFTAHEADFLFKNSIELKDSLNRQLFFLVIAILLLMFVVTYLLIRNIRRPINQLASTVKSFQGGDMNVRCVIDARNEFGELSESFNSMVESIQINAELGQKASELSQVMLLEEEPRKFFASVLPTLAAQTNSQMAAIYLLSEDKKRFEHFESFGMSNSSKLTFDIDNFEGEFGSVLLKRKVMTIKRIPKDTRFLFHTVSGKLVPREIITIPIISGKEIIAIISLASVRTYASESRLLITNVLDTLTARIEGVLSYQRIQKFSKTLEFQNRELESQKVELETQSFELTEQNRELEMQKIQLNEASQLKTNFLSNMSHELRTPLNSVIALSGVLSRRLANKIPSDEFSYLEVIERNGKHLLSLINDILDISRIESGREEIEITRFTAGNLISDVVTMIKPQTHQKNIELIHKADGKDILINTDFDKCRHILQNLIGNAVKFTEKGSVVVEVVENEDKLEISVADTGIGISENHIAHIFDEFRQADGGTSRKFGGTGLGLAIAKKYANLLGGDVAVKSVLGKGSTFTVSLPLNYSADNRVVETIRVESEFKPIISKPPQKHNSKKTILLVEDSEPAIIQIKDFLEESGYNILVADGGSEALDIISKAIPDAIILDLMMPGVDGFEVLKNLREAESTASVPVLILTAKHITKDDLKLLKRSNVHQLIQKGDVNRVEMLNSVASMLFTEKEESVNQISPVQAIDGKPTVLIVEDNADNMITVKALIGDNFEIFEAVDGVQGVITAKECIPNLILMDIALPGVDGIEAFKTIRSNGKLSHIPIIALTASAMNSDRETILAYGFDAYLAKPIDEKVFFNTINEVLYGK
jgi:signal transduction histidine kinase/CheY-like chemotaxis protein/HAMP domain-containing protein